jgi:uncharacterized protein
MITRRQFLIGAGASAATSLGLGGYAFGVEPILRLTVADYAIAPEGWPADFPLTIAVIADVHAVEPWMSAQRIAAIAAFTNRLNADLVLLAGDYESGLDRVGRLARKVAMTDCAAALATLRAPLGVHAVLGNHDMWTNDGRDVRAAFAANDIPILENKAIRLAKHGRPFWLLGLGDQWSRRARGGYDGDDDLPGTLAQVSDSAPAILLAHEPFIFPRVPGRVALTISGHTHGGQVRLPFIGPLVKPSLPGERSFVYGHYCENGRDLVVSAGLGMSILPLRFGVPPEIVLIRLGSATVA